MAPIFGRSVGGGSSILTTPIQVTGLKAVGQDGGVLLTCDPATEASAPYLKDLWVVWKKVSDGPIQNPYDGQHMTFAAQTGPVGQDLAKLAPGSTLKIVENNVPTQFLVLQHGYPTAGDAFTLLLRKDIYDNRAWGASDNHWDGNSTDVFLNNEYLLFIEEKVRSQIPEIAMPYVPGNGNWTASTIQRKVGLLTATEAGLSGANMPVCGTPIPYFDSDLKRIAYYNQTATTWWTMTPDSGNAGAAWNIGTSGTGARYIDIASQHGSRPKFCLPSTTQVSLEPDSQGDYTLVA